MGYVAVAVAFEGSWYFDAVVAGLRRSLAPAGHEVRVHLVPYGPDARASVAALLDDDLRRPECAGAVAVTFRLEPLQTERLLGHGKPVVVVGGPCRGLPSVGVDDVRAARIATQHLLDLGHSSIAHLGGYTIGPDDSTMRGDRVRGYSEAMHAAGLDDLSSVHPTEFGPDAARRTAERLLAARDRPTAVFAVSDEVAFAALDAARDLGLDVPGDLCVVGVDDEPRAAGRGLTTVRQDPAALGEAAAGLLLQRTGADHLVLDVALAPRRSTGARDAPRVTGASLLARLLGGRRRRTGGPGR